MRGTPPPEPRPRRLRGRRRRRVGAARPGARRGRRARRRGSRSASRWRSARWRWSPRRASPASCACPCRRCAGRCPSAGAGSGRCRSGARPTAPAWALGVLTHQAVATFWVVCAAAVWLAEPAAGRHRRWRRSGPDAPSPRRCRRTRGRCGARPLLLRLNAIVLVLCAALVVAPAADARPQVLNLGPGSQDDPSFSNGVLAFTQRGPAAGVVVAPPNAAALHGPWRGRHRARRGPAGLPRRGRHRRRRLAHGRAGDARRLARRRPARAGLALARLPPPGRSGRPRARAARSHRPARSGSSPSSSGATTSRAPPSARAAWRGLRSPVPAAPCGCWPCPGARPTCCVAAAASC